MNEFLTWQMAQFMLAAAITGGTIGAGTYEYEHYRPPYQESTYRARRCRTSRGEIGRAHV